MKIVRVVTRLNIGGPSIHVTLLSTQLDPVQFDTCLVVGKPGEKEGDLSSQAAARGARLIRLRHLVRPLRPWKDLLAWIQMVRILLRERPRILHTHMAKAGTLGRFAGIFYNRWGPGRVPGHRVLLLHTFHGHVLEGYFSPWLSNRFAAMERWLARRTDCLIAVSPRIRNELLRRGIGRSESWRVVPLGLDLSKFVDLPLPNGTEPLRFGWVGRLVPIKNPDLFLRGFGQLIREGSTPDSRAFIFGEGPLRKGLEAAVRTSRLEDRVHFTGWQEDLLRAYQNLDIVCLTSLNEGTPLSLIEAMAAGRAVVATDVGGVRDLLDPGTPEILSIPPGGFSVTPVGLLIRSGDSQGLAAALRHLAQNPSLRLKLGETARQRVRERFNHERLLREISLLYEELAESRP